jgi:hypothetical protein
VKIFTANRFEARDGAGELKEFIDSDGFKSVRWRDEYMAGDLEFGAGGVTIPPVASVVLVADEIGEEENESPTLTMRVRNFDTGNRVAYGTFELAHDIDFAAVNDAGSGIAIEAHVHWIPLGTDTGDMVWRLDYMVLHPDGTNSVALTVYATDTIAENSQNKHRLKAFNGGVLAIPAGGWKIGSVLAFAIRRHVATQTYTDGAGMLKVALHVPVNDRGSRQIYVK